MAIRIPWDSCEAAYLLSELVRVLNNEISRSEAIQLVSTNLRKRALQRGIEIDDVFRNTNGITLQMSVMEYIYTEGKHGLKKSSMPKLFQDIVDMYKSDKNSFEVLAREAVSMPSDKMIEEQFYTWLSTQVSPHMLSELYTAFGDIDSFCIERKILKQPLLETADLTILNNVRMTVERNKIFRFLYRRQLSKMSAGMWQYITFIKSHPELSEGFIKDETKSIGAAKDKERTLSSEIANDKLIQLLNNRGLTYVDLRSKGGCLWIIGGTTLSPFVAECQQYGIIFHYKIDGGNATSGKSAWWTMDSYREPNHTTSVTNSDATIPEDKQTAGKILTLNFESYNKLSFTKPVAFSYFGEEHQSLDSWKQLYVEVIRCLYEDYPDILFSYVNKNLFGQGRIDFSDMSHQRQMISPKQITDGFYVETNLSATDIISKTKHILDICRVDYENIIIQYVEKKAEDPADEGQVIAREKVQNPLSVAASTGENRKSFIGWMQQSGISNATILSYLSAIGQCTKSAQQLKFIESDFYDIEGTSEIIKVRDKLLSVPSFKQLNDRQHNRFLSAMNKLIAFRQEHSQSYNANNTSSVVSSSGKESLSITNEIKERYEYILTTYFGEDGYQPGRAIFRGRFKNFYASEYGTEPTETDERIDGLLQQIGTVRDSRIFPKQDGEQNDLLREIIEDIMSAFEEGASGIYIEAVFDKYQEKLANSLQIYNVEALTPMLLANSKGAFTQKYSYLVKKWENANSASDILRIMQAFHQPQNYEAIHKKAWYIPFDKMKALLVWDKSIVNVAPETYFYAPNLPVSASEIQQLISVIRTELEYRSHITDVELVDLIRGKCPSIAINTDSFTTYGLRNCLGYILRDYFSFNGPIISELGKELSMSDVYAEFARNHEELSFEDLKRLSAEMDISIYWESILGEMVRVSDKKMIRRDLIDFDVDLIDNILEEMCPEQYMPLKDINLFLQFPNIGYAWNHYVLESYLFQNSQKFKLLHVSFGQNSVCGAMVRSDSPIADYRTLILDALSKSNALGSTKAALQFIVDRGYQQRRRYDGIEQLIQEAKLIKEQRENAEK